MKTRLHPFPRWRADVATSAALAIALCGASTFAQCPPGGTGPDVVVGELTGPANYASFHGIEAVTFGTTSCNVGDAELLWIANSNQHPVIGQNLFRLKDGRFEHIGQAWLKHGFTALQGNACGCGCTPSGTGTRLGVGCSDPYGAGLNGSQTGMGPKWQVDAHTGNFAWSPANFSDTGSSVFKRVQVKIADIDPAQNGGGLYFAEGQYVTPDDSANGNQNNNASYREVLVTGSGGAWNFSLAGSTQRTLAGIRAWKDHDPEVVETDVQIPREGLVIVAAKATELGSGLWSYEYAVQNLNSDRSVGSFSVPIDPDAIVTAIGFHDVPYHSGEPWNGADWVGEHVGGEVVWSCPQTFAQNQFANALRWGTLYNFRFVANAEPIDTSVTLGLFKPGTPDSVSADTIGPAVDMALEVLPVTGIIVHNGGMTDGDAPDFQLPDNAYIIIQSEQMSSGQQSDFVIRLQSPTVKVQEMKLTVELSAVGPQASFKSQVFLRNWAQGRWDGFDVFTVTAEDQVKVYANIPNPSDYIQPANGDVRVRILTTRGNTTQPFEVRIDQVEVTVVP